MPPWVSHSPFPPRLQAPVGEQQTRSVSDLQASGQVPSLACPPPRRHDWKPTFSWQLPSSEQQVVFESAAQVVPSHVVPTSSAPPLPAAQSIALASEHVKVVEQQARTVHGCDSHDSSALNFPPTAWHDVAVRAEQVPPTQQAPTPAHGFGAHDCSEGTKVPKHPVDSVRVHPPLFEQHTPCDAHEADAQLPAVNDPPCTLHCDCVKVWQVPATQHAPGVVVAVQANSEHDSPAAKPYSHVSSYPSWQRPLGSQQAPG
jgi:hypothetical protein